MADDSPRGKTEAIDLHADNSMRVTRLPDGEIVIFNNTKNSLGQRLKITSKMGKLYVTVHGGASDQLVIRTLHGMPALVAE